MTPTSARIHTSEPAYRPALSQSQRDRMGPVLPMSAQHKRMSAMTEGMLAGAFVGFMIGVGALFGGAW